MKILKRLWIRFTVCRKLNHDFRLDTVGVIGDWIRCKRCHYLDEYILGTHEPKGYISQHDMWPEQKRS